MSNNEPQENVNNSSTHEAVYILVRIFSAFFWCVIYIGFFWYLGYRTEFEKLIGYTALVLGIVGILCPVKFIGKKYWVAIMAGFYISGLLLITMVQ